MARVSGPGVLGSCPGPQSTPALLKGLPLLGPGSVRLAQSLFWKRKSSCEASSFVMELILVFFIKDYRIRHLAGQRCHIASPSRPLQGDTTERCFPSRRRAQAACPSERGTAGMLGQKNHTHHLMSRRSGGHKAGAGGRVRLPPFLALVRCGKS